MSGASNAALATAIGIASAIAAHRREAARWREIAAVLREVSGAT